MLSSSVFHLCLQLYDLHLKIIVLFLHLRQFFLRIFQSDLRGDQFMLQIIHFFIFHLDIVFKGITLLFGFKIVICDIQCEEYISCISTLLSVALAVCTFCYLVVQIGRYFLQVLFAFEPA